MKIFLSFFLFLIVSFSCTSNQSTDIVLYNTNFKLADFFLQQIDSLQKTNASLNLKVELNKKTSIIDLGDVIWQKELQTFSDLAIENQKYKDTFVCDTTTLTNGSILLKYLAKENSKIKLVEIFIVDNKVKTVFAKLNSTNYLYTTSTTLYYETDNYFAINAKDNFRGLGFLNSDLLIKGVIKNEREKSFTHK